MASNESQAINADFVIVFNLPKLKDSKKNIDRNSISEQVQEEYDRLIETLHNAGLRAIGRPGKPGSNQVLIFVRVRRERLEQEMERERISDCLRGVGSAQVKKEPRDFNKDPFTMSERLRNVYRIITFDESAADLDTSTGHGAYAGIIPNSSTYPHVSIIFPPHDPEFNAAWMARWSSFACLFTIPPEDMLLIRHHFGGNIALYFEFLRFYFIHLLFPAFLGVIFWKLRKQFHPLYSASVLLWSLFFVEGWRLREKKISIRWNTSSVTAIGRARAHYKPDSYITDQVSGQKIGKFAWWKRELRIATSLPALLGFSSCLAVLISVAFCLEVIIDEAYNGPLQQVLPLLPTILFSGLVPQVIALWQKNAEWLTSWENYESEDSHEFSMTIKMFIMNCLVAYGALTLTAYVYLPFGSYVIPRVITYAKDYVQVSKIPPELLEGFSKQSFSADPSRLVNTLVALMTTSQIVNAFTEVVLPVLTRWATNKFSKKTEPNGDGDTLLDHDDEKEYLERIRREADLEEYSLFNEFGEMVTQYGYIVLWSVVWPLAPFMAFLNNFVELRSDAFKLCVNSRRPVPFRRDTIGPWLDALGLITWIGALTNSSLIYMFWPIHTGATSSSLLIEVSEKVSSAAASALNESDNFMISEAEDGSILHSAISLASAAPNPFAATKSVVFSAMLIALATEHGYFMARVAVRHLLKRIFWDNSPEDIQLRKDAYLTKQSGLETVKSEEMAKRTNATEGDRIFGKEEHVNATKNFWTKPDQGKEAIQHLFKVD